MPVYIGQPPSSPFKLPYDGCLERVWRTNALDSRLLTSRAGNVRFARRVPEGNVLLHALVQAGLLPGR